MVIVNGLPKENQQQFKDEVNNLSERNAGDANEDAKDAADVTDQLAQLYKEQDLKNNLL